MIAQLTGTVVEKGARAVTLDVHGVGYRVSVTPELLARARGGETLTLLTHLAVRDDALDLYGFETPRERSAFGHLITVSGIGPKTAMNILSLTSVETLEHAVASGDSGYLTRISGVGKKIAHRIVSELKETWGETLGVEGGTPSEDADVVEAMRALGFSPADAREALAQVPESVKDVGARIKEALKHVRTRA